MTTTKTTGYHNYYGSRADTKPPPGMSRSTYRRRFKLGQLPGTQMPGRGGGIIVTRVEWDAWLASKGQVAA